jgi:hypothetical protein
MAKVDSEMTFTLAVPVYLEPSGLVPVALYFRCQRERVGAGRRRDGEKNERAK